MHVAWLKSDIRARTCACVLDVSRVRKQDLRMLLDVSRVRKQDLLMCAGCDQSKELYVYWL
ncbi:hypothetical protein DUNSADRAFT_15602 [Dunaliella salina]|uniref:Uncharacterized protein n=1 Tax=Dunaliella salina TaxID=3046 RepID=A0ABQ7H1K5_DUNSA|nr:hypothetical protein DUNSADRAFT_15602 [Dunaliella salina]|eukprot:KAF5840744.1 hypothetical protein DUNSADRAFT_15602 [Dunaliella salina]